MRRFNSSRVKALGNLQPTSEKQKAHLRRTLGLKKMFSLDAPAPAIKKTRDYVCPMKADFVPPKPRGKSHVVMGGAARAALAARMAAREKFLCDLGV